LAGAEGCANSGDNAPDAVFLYTAPFAGDFLIDTIGSGYDTQLSVRQQSCAGMELGCSDDIDPQSNQQSALNIPLLGGQTILIAVDGHDSVGGPFALNIRSTPATATPTRTRTPTATRTATHTRTPTRTASASATASRTRTATGTRTATLQNTATRSQTATRTSVPTASSTATRTTTASATRSRSATATTSSTPTSTATPTRSA